MARQLDRFLLSDALNPAIPGNTFRAEEVLLGDAKRTVALKVLPPVDAKERLGQGRFYALVKALGAIGSHPHIVNFLSLGVPAAAPFTPWIATEIYPATLAAEITDQGAAPASVARLIEHIASALAHLHSLAPCLLHNDVKPTNILIDAQRTFKLADFVLAGPVSADPTQPSDMIRYAAPELLAPEFGKIAPATDLYALGHVAYEYALGGRLYRQQFPAVYDAMGKSSNDAAPQKWMAWHCSLSALPMSVHEARKDFPVALSNLIARLMQKSLTGRYSAAIEVLADLKQLAGNVPAPGIAAVRPVGGSTDYELADPLGGQHAPAAPPPRRHHFAAATPVAASDDVASSASYYVRLRGKTTGPFDLGTLQRHARQGLISRLHQVSTDQSNWRSASTLEGLFGNPVP